MNTSKELKEKIASGQKTAILPFGSTEQHGNHLSTGYDTLIANRISLDLALELKAFVLPEFNIGEASHHLGFPGTLTFSNETLQKMLTDLCDSLKLSGITRLIIVNGHGGNYRVIKSFAKNYQNKNFQIIHDGESEILFKVISNLSTHFSGADLGLHAGFFETSLALYTHSDAVRVNDLEIGEMPPKGTEWTKSLISNLISNGLLETAPSGVIGNPCLANLLDGKNFYALILKEYLQLCVSVK